MRLSVGVLSRGGERRGRPASALRVIYGEDGTTDMCWSTTSQRSPILT